jgi:hypothetical protein
MEEKQEKNSVSAYAWHAVVPCENRSPKNLIREKSGTVTNQIL